MSGRGWREELQAGLVEKAFSDRAEDIPPSLVLTVGSPRHCWVWGEAPQCSPPWLHTPLCLWPSPLAAAVYIPVRGCLAGHASPKRLSQLHNLTVNCPQGKWQRWPQHKHHSITAITPTQTATPESASSNLLLDL